MRNRKLAGIASSIRGHTVYAISIQKDRKNRRYRTNVGDIFEFNFKNFGCTFYVLYLNICELWDNWRVVCPGKDVGRCKKAWVLLICSLSKIILAHEPRTTSAPRLRLKIIIPKPATRLNCFNASPTPLLRTRLAALN